MKDVTLRQLEYFLAVAETQSITAAAQRSHVSQAAVSVAITDLEKALGTTLTIRRRAKGVTLTPEGRAILADARSIVEQTTELAAHVAHAQNELSGVLDIGCFRTLSMHVVPHLVEWFALHHPRIQLKIHEGNGTEIQDRMLAGQLSVCLIYEAQLNGECRSHLIRDNRRLALLPANHPLVAQPVVALAELAEHPAVLLNEEPALERTLNEFRRRSLEPQVLLRTRSVQTAQNIIGRGLAYGILMHVPDRSPEGHPVVGRPISDEIPRNALVASLPPGNRPSAKVRALLECLSELP